MGNEDRSTVVPCLVSGSTYPTVGVPVEHKYHTCGRYLAPFVYAMYIDVPCSLITCCKAMHALYVS